MAAKMDAFRITTILRILSRRAPHETQCQECFSKQFVLITEKIGAADLSASVIL